MQWITNKPMERVVELDDAELAAQDTFDSLLDEGKSPVEAATLTAERHPNLTDEFMQWLIG